MSPTNPEISTGVRLRRDLRWLEADDPRDTAAAREVLLIDALRGRYVRLLRPVAEQLQDDPSTVHPGLLQQAASAGLLACRTEARTPSRWNPAQWLYLKLPALPIDRLASLLARHTDIFFSWQAVLFWTLLQFLALATIPVFWQRFHANLPGLEQFLSAGNVIALGVTLVVTKLLHELAHATVCRRLGARPGGIGLLLLAGIPCPYCDVTDSWRLSKRWKRIAIMLAGVYMEGILATIALLIWWVTPAGPLHFTAMNVVILCSLSTLLFNLNPLMRYDGYYVLADLVRSDHLRQEAGAAAKRCGIALLGRGDAAPASGLDRRTRCFAGYHVLASAYRVVISITIALWIGALARQLHLGAVGVTIGTVLIVGVVAAKVRSGSRFLRGQGGWNVVPKWRRVFVAASGLAGLLALLLIPLPASISATGMIDVADASVVYLPEAGRVQQVHADWGDPVQAGEPLVTLVNEALDRQQLELDGRQGVLAVKTVTLRRRALEQTDLLQHWDQQTAMLADLDKQAERLRRRREACRVVAPKSGTVLPPLPESFATETPEAQQRDPFTDRRVGALAEDRLSAVTGSWAREGGRWCRIADPSQRRVVLSLASHQRAAIQLGQPLRVRCRQAPAQVLHLKIRSIASQHQQRIDASGIDNRFQVACRVPNDADVTWQIGAEVTARLRAPPISLGRRLWRHLEGWMRGSR